MSKIPLLQNKESLIGYAVFSGAFILFIINAIFIVRTLIAVYGQQASLAPAASIDGTVISDAVELINPR